MRVISHRGNLMGPNSCLENSPDSINLAISKGFDCEIDIWVIGESLLLGHDFGEFPVTEQWLIDRKDKLWLHLKNQAAMNFFLRRNAFHYFWHENDAYTLTSRGLPWIYPGKPIVDNSILVLPELFMDDLSIHNLLNSTSLVGICTDFPARVRESVKP